ncbi:MAG: L,D-transpeptidase family protein [Breoghania sp.]|nr:L,D-transpeptidase family protein [Breoghania sp.]MDJ0930469.1 L,D-transpeptidase family protein [Breoghania sp.]
MGNIYVRALSASRTRGRLIFGPLSVACALGRTGISHEKREGDGATPSGRYRLLQVLYRADRIQRPITRLPVCALKPHDGWCDDPRHGRYNRPVRLPFSASHERLWREDHLYDVVVILDHNQKPRSLGGGSAVFCHLARPGYLPTEGCVAVSLADMCRLLAMADKTTAIHIA